MTARHPLMLGLLLAGALTIPCNARASDDLLQLLQTKRCPQCSLADADLVHADDRIAQAPLIAIGIIAQRTAANRRRKRPLQRARRAKRHQGSAGIQKRGGIHSQPTRLRTEVAAMGRNSAAHESNLQSLYPAQPGPSPRDPGRRKRRDPIQNRSLQRAIHDSSSPPDAWAAACRRLDHPLQRPRQ